MAKMTDDVKLALRERARARRKESPLARDWSLDDWRVACDFAKDMGLGAEEDEALLESGECMVALLRFAPRGAADLLASLLPRRLVRLRAYPGTKHHKVGHPVWLFRSRTLLAILGFLRLDRAVNDRGRSKYYTIEAVGWAHRWQRWLSNPPGGIQEGGIS